MAVYMDFFNIYIMGCVQMLTGFYFLTRFLQKKVKPYFYLLLAIVWCLGTRFIPVGRTAESLGFVMLLMVSGVLVCRADWRSSALFAALTVVIMQISYGIVNSLLGILYPWMSHFDQEAVGTAFMLFGNFALPLSVFCHHITYRYISFHEAAKKQAILMILTPTLLLFLVGEYIGSVIYGNSVVTHGSGIVMYTDHIHMLVIQLLGKASLFCIMLAYKKLLQNFRLSTELSLLEQEERSLNQYVEEAKARYEKTRSFRHDIKNHITVVKDLLQNGKTGQALDYIRDLADRTEELSFPCATNNPVADILLGNKLGMAESMGIDVSCSLLLPQPCSIRDIDFCIILSNALDNAIQACKNMDARSGRYIRVTGHMQGDFILMEVENSFQGKGLVKSGTGLSNIKAVAEKYHGAVSIKTRETEFVLSVLLIIPRHPDSSSRQIG